MANKQVNLRGFKIKGTKITMQRNQEKEPLYGYHVQLTNYLASDHGEPHVENADTPKQAPIHYYRGCRFLVTKVKGDR